MMRWLHGLRAAVGFLTRIPMGAVSGESMAAAIAWFPIVGLMIGGAAGGVYAGFHELATPAVAAALALSAEWLITGAFHQDGLADMADGFGGGWTPERRLEIMKDSRHGTYGVMSLVAIALVQFSALSALGPAAGTIALVAANGLSRGAAVAVMMLVEPAREGGLGVDYRAGLRPVSATCGIVVAVALIGVLSGPLAALALVGGAAVAACFVALLSVRKIGGIAGDVLGAVQQVAAASILVIAVIVAVRR